MLTVADRLDIVRGDRAVPLALASTGFIFSTRAKPFYIAVGALIGIFSLVIGAFFNLGIGSDLPDVLFVGTD